MIIMKNYVYKGKYYNIHELSELSGVKYSTLCERLKNGYSVEEAVALDTRIPDSILEFDSASDYKDWDGMINEELYGDYRQWCSNNDFFQNRTSTSPNVSSGFIRTFELSRPV